MTVTANTTRNDYTAGSAQSVYNYTFQLNEAADVDVYLNGVKQTLNTHYTVQNVDNASGGTITFTLVDASNNPIHPTQGAVINIVMAMDLDRDTNYQPSGAFLAADVNNDFDRLWHASNQQQTAINRSLRLQDTDVTTSTMELPLKDARKGKLLGFNASTGDPEATTNNQTNWDTAYNDRITSASFSGSTLTLGQQDGGTITASHTPYLPIAGGTLTGDLAFGVNKAVFPSLEIYGAIGDHSIIEETGSGNLIIKGTDVRIQSADNEDVIKGVANGAVTLYYNNAPKLATTNTGISITGTLSATGYNSSNWDTAYNDKINAVNYSNNTLTLTQQDGSTLTTTINGGGGGGGETLAQTLAIGDTTGGNDISFGDNDKATFNSNLNIFSSGTSSYIEEVGAGDLYLKASNLYITDRENNQFISMIDNGAGGTISLKHLGSPKLATTSTGIDVTGTATMDGLTVDGTGYAYLGNTAAYRGELNYDSSGNTSLTIANSWNNDNSEINFKVKTAGTGKKALQIKGSGDISFYEDTGTTPSLLWDSSATALTITGRESSRSSNTYAFEVDNSAQTSNLSASGSFRVKGNTGDSLVVTGQGNVGIGTTSPNYSLTSYKVGANANYLQVVNGSSGPNAANGILYGLDGAGNGVINKQGAGDLITSVAGAERMRIDSSGRLLIGRNASASNANADDLQIGNTSGTHGLTILSQNNSVGAIYFADNNNNDAGTITYDHAGNALRFNTNRAERMRIDSSGNLLVGTTDSDTGNAGSSTGIALGSVGYLTVARNGATPLYANRLSSDGEVISIRKDGTTVGAISVINGNNLRIGGTADNHAGLQFGTNIIYPEKGAGGNISDGTIDIGNAGGRFKDLYLSAGAYASFIAGQNDTNTSINFAGSDVITFNNGGSEAARIDSSGLVGIGATNPSSQFFNNLVVGNNNAGDKGITIRSNASNSGVLAFSDTDSATDGRYSGYIAYNHSDNAMKLHTNGGTERVRIDSSGNVGIGTASPDRALHVNSGTTNEVARFESTDTACLVEFKDTTGTASIETRNDFRFSAGGSEKMRIDSSGNVGIGTSSPAALLHVDSGNSGVTPTSGTQLFLEGTANATLQLGTLYTGNSRINFGRGSTPGGPADVDVGRILYNAQLNYMGFSTNNQERFRVDSSGRMLIGTTSLGSYGAKLRVEGNVEGYRYIASSYGSTFKDSGNFGVAGITLHSWSSGGTFSQKLMSFQNSGTTEYGAITVSGSTVTYGTTSDERLKENIKDAEDAGDKIDAIKIRQFDWKEGGQHQDYGVIAQELDEVAPEAVAKGTTEDDMMAVDYSKLVPTLIKEIQSLRNRVAELEKN